MTLNLINNLLAPLISVSKGAYNAIQIALFLCMVVCAIITIVIILFQPGNTNGSAAISGSAETFFGKNSSNSLEGKLKKWTIIALCVIIVFSILFFMVSSEILIGVGAVIGG